MRFPPLWVGSVLVLDGEENVGRKVGSHGSFFFSISPKETLPLLLNVRVWKPLVPTPTILVLLRVIEGKDGGY